jgi:hypothetical protein
MTYNWFLAQIKQGIPNIGEPDKYDHFKHIQLSKLNKHKLSTNMQNLAKEIAEKRILL